MRMIEFDAMMRRNLDENPARMAEMKQHHHAIIGALNESHTPGEPGTQDAMCVLEAIAHTLAQVMGAHPEGTRSGAIAYVAHRAAVLAPFYEASGKCAQFKVVD